MWLQTRYNRSALHSHAPESIGKESPGNYDMEFATCAQTGEIYLAYENAYLWMFGLRRRLFWKLKFDLDVHRGPTVTLGGGGVEHDNIHRKIITAADENTRKVMTGREVKYQFAYMVKVAVIWHTVVLKWRVLVYLRLSYTRSPNYRWVRYILAVFVPNLVSSGLFT